MCSPIGREASVRGSRAAVSEGLRAALLVGRF